MRDLRFPGESGDEFRARAERAGRVARILVEAALANHCVRQLIADKVIGHSEASVRMSPPVRIEYEQAIAIGDLGTCLRATKSKHWGDGPYVLPLEPDDPVDAMRVLYLFRENSVYNRRFLQRRKLKELLGKKHRKLVQTAMQSRWTKDLFLAELTIADREAIERCLHLTPSEFWHAAKGQRFLAQLPAERQLTLGLEIAEEARDSRPLGPPVTLDDFGEVVRCRSKKKSPQRQICLDFGDDLQSPRGK